jgi:hypothetical protein
VLRGFSQAFLAARDASSTGNHGIEVTESFWRWKFQNPLISLFNGDHVEARF